MLLLTGGNAQSRGTRARTAVGQFEFRLAAVLDAKLALRQRLLSAISRHMQVIFAHTSKPMDKLSEI
jgi:hypothetical protein